MGCDLMVFAVLLVGWVGVLCFYLVCGCLVDCLFDVWI